MASKQAQEDEIETIRLFLRKWIGVFSLVGACAGVFYQHKKGVVDLALSVEQIRKDFDTHLALYDADHRVGPDGFSDPRVRLALDEHIRKFLRAYTADAERSLLQWRHMFFDINPQLRRPTE